ncbi:unnamed protein product [Phaedon cochleariae]|uniref:Protein-tyrosine sulfotransferase n=1 Tax=Phaedon cochleariae TaxID=80249 RepID=A0A9N9SAN0_PHACE|nr:unnamed protein product [Phaedon cochleariae]
MQLTRPFRGGLKKACGLLCALAVVYVLVHSVGLIGTDLPAGAAFEQKFLMGGDKKFGYDRRMPLIFIGGVPRCGQETRVIPRLLQMRFHWLKSEKESMRLEQAGITKEVLDSAIAAFTLEIIARHGEPAARLCNKDPLTIKMGTVERSSDQVIKPVNLEALTKWVGHIPDDVVRDMADIAPMLSVLGYDPYANPPDYGKPDEEVAHKTKQIQENRNAWDRKAKEMSNVDMATDSPTERTEVSISEEIGPSDDSLDNTLKPHNESCEESESNTTIHGFNISNITVIERQIVDQDDHTKIGPQCEGSDSGVEVVETLDVCALKRNLSSNSATSQDLDINCTQSCNSSIISCCSNYDEAYNLLVRKNSTLLEDYRRHGDVTSENGSESSSISGSQLRSTRRTSFNGAKKKVTTTEPRAKPTTKDRSRSKPPVNPRASTGPTRLKSVDRSQLKPSQSTKPSGTKNKNAPTSLDLAGGSKKDTRKASSATVRTSSNSRTASTTPSDDGRWPSVNSKPAPLMSRSLKGSLDSPKQKLSQLDAKTIEKYATLPRQKKEKVADSVRDQKKSRSRENTLHRIALTKKSSRDINPTPSKTTNSLLLPKSKAKTKIYHESSIQTVLTMSDVENALTGATVSPKTPLDLEKCDMYVQVELSDPEVEKLQRMLGQLNDKFESLQVEHLKQTEKLKETESKLTDVTIEKEGLRKELENNTQRVLAILGDTDPDNASSDSLMVLESKFQNVGQVVVQQEEEISRLNMLCRSLQMDLERHLSAQRILQRQHEDLEMESMELQDFMQAEKMTLHDALKESEIEIQRQKTVIKQKEKEVAEQQEEYRQLVTLSEQQRLENINLQSRLGVLESKSRELLVQQGSTVSGAAVALSSLIGRLDGLVEELVSAYSISEQELEKHYKDSL